MNRLIRMKSNYCSSAGVVASIGDTLSMSAHEAEMIVSAGFAEYVESGNTVVAPPPKKRSATAEKIDQLEKRLEQQEREVKDESEIVPESKLTIEDIDFDALKELSKDELLTIGRRLDLVIDGRLGVARIIEEIHLGTGVAMPDDYWDEDDSD